jgi:hypothetical protein
MKNNKKVLQLSNDRAINLNFIHIIFFNCRSMSFIFSSYVHLILFFLCSFVPIKKNERMKEKISSITTGSTRIRTQKKRVRRWAVFLLLN